MKSVLKTSCLGSPSPARVDPVGISQSVEVIDGTAVYFLLPEFFFAKVRLQNTILTHSSQGVGY